MPVYSLWMIFTALAVLGIVGYDIAIKLAADSFNPFIFTTIIVAVALVGHLIALGVYKILNPDLVLTTGSSAIMLAAVAGLGLIAVDLGFYYAVKSGGLLKTNAVWLIGSLVVTSLIGLLVFHEPINTSKMIGIALGMVSVVLMIM